MRAAPSHPTAILTPDGLAAARIECARPETRNLRKSSALMFNAMGFLLPFRFFRKEYSLN